MPLVEDLIGRYFGTSDGELTVGGIRVSDLATNYGTPLYVYSREVLDRKLFILRNALPANISIYYSVKANPNGTILRYFLDKGCGLEIASGGELHQALKAGCPPQKIIFAGPGKTPAELEMAIAAGIGEIHAESLLEVDRIGTISRQTSTRARVSLRVNPSGDAQGGAMRMGGRAAPFGIDEEVFELALDRVLQEPGIEFCGIHLFTGTQILDHTDLLNHYRKGLDIAKRAAARLGHPLHTVDFGGGLGIPYFAEERELDMEELRLGIAGLMEYVCREPLWAGTQFIIEPGRFLVGESGVYLTRINDIKISRGKKFLVVDGGMHHHLAASGNLGQVIKKNFPLVLANKLSSPLEDAVNVVGPLCTPLDTLARSVRLPRAQVGDIVSFFQSGAYGRT